VVQGGCDLSVIDLGSPKDATRLIFEQLGGCSGEANQHAVSSMVFYEFCDRHLFRWFHGLATIEIDVAEPHRVAAASVFGF
jgi:hypothetical protein